MTLRPWLGSWSTYTVLGLAGYVVAAIVVGQLGLHLGLDGLERAAAIVAPAIGFVIAVFTARAVARVEKIVFYQTAIAAWTATAGVAWITGMPALVLGDLATILIAIFLAFGRIGCLHVACCHGRPSRVGVRYTAAHVVLGFPRRWLARRIFPIQLVESLVSLALAIACSVVVLSASPGAATCVFVTCYALVRFPLELARGDTGRPYAKGLSEAQWIALATTAVVVALWPGVLTIGAACVLAAMAIVVVFTNRFGRSLELPRHLDEIEHTVARLVDARDVSAAWTSCGLKISARALPDGGVDVVWSHDRLTETSASHAACAVFDQPRIVPGRSPGLFHVLVDATRRPAR